MKAKKSISREFFGSMMLVTIVAILIFGFLDIRSFYNQFRQNSQELQRDYLNERKSRIKGEVEKVIFYVNEMIEHYEKHKHDKELAQMEILEEIIELRFDEEGYFFGCKFNGDPLFSNGEITIGTGSLNNLQDAKGTNIFQTYLSAIQNPEGDFITYYWNKIGETAPKAKISFVKSIPEWNWIIGAGIYQEDIEHQVKSQILFLRRGVKSKVISFIILAFILIAISIFIAKLFSQKISNEFEVFLNAFQNPEKNYADIDPEKMHYLSTTILARSTRNMLKEQIRSHNELLEKENQLRNVMNINPHFIYVKNKKGQYLLANKASAKVYGLTPEELEGKTDTEVTISKQEARKFREDDLLIIKGKKEKISREETITDNKGNKKYLYTIKKPIKMSSENDLSVLGISIDITELKLAQQELEKKNQELQREMKQRQKAEESLENSRAQLFSIIQNSTNIFYTHTSQHLITYISPQIEKVLGYKPEEALEHWTELISNNPVNQKGIEITEKALKTGEVQSPYELELLHKNGSKVWVEVREAPVKSGDSMIMVGSLTDITERKITQKELQKHKVELEKTVLRRTKELEDQNKKYALTQKALSYLMEDVNEMRKEVEEANEQLTYANQELESFSYSVSHDLRAPLRAINGFITILADEYKTVLDEGAYEYIDIVKDNANKMSNLINDLLEFSRVSRKEISGNQFDIYKEFNSVFNDLVKQYPELKIKLKLHKMAQVQADKKMIRQVIHNLVSNAIKYSSKEDEIIIEIGMSEKEKEFEFYVKDNGVGFNEDYKNKLFGVFQRLHTPEEFEGTGVGLAIVKRIIMKHNGKVRATAKEGEGATFYFSLPKHFGEKEEKMTQEQINAYAKELIELEKSYKDIFEEDFDTDEDF